MEPNVQVRASRNGSNVLELQLQLGVGARLTLARPPTQSAIYIPHLEEAHTCPLRASSTTVPGVWLLAKL